SIERITYAPPPARAPATEVSTAAVQASSDVSLAARKAPSARGAKGERPSETVYWVQLGAFTEAARAEALASALNADGNFVELFAFRNKGVLYRRVRVGPFATIGDARLERNQLAAQNVSGIVVRQRVPKNP
ncbi:MAG: SPOR domain-containing protein, partial [Elusimicrobia bacterium]|nr:SPOR domain-containing protein [Elusimicrobiota bacterium]